MRQLIFAAALLPFPAFADMERARDLMEAGKFEAARAEFEIYARSGNADAEELIGVMYALGLGVAQDNTRAFDWYLRSSLKGHPGAQSGLAWYYEVGRGIPAPDLVRAYLWYTLSSIGGDVDAPDSLASLTPKLTAEQRKQADLMIDDYRAWMYPFR
ncbi:MAG: tetratricopeptide repeat protein [Sulfitobacter sp.]